MRKNKNSGALGIEEPAGKSVCSIGELTRCDGSAKVEMGKTIVVAGIHGPNEARGSQQQYSSLLIDIKVYGLTSEPWEKEKMSHIEKILGNCFESMIDLTFYPRLAITITFQILQDFGSVLACCINAGCLALIDSGLSMHFVVAATNCSLSSNHEVHLNKPRPKQHRLIIKTGDSDTQLDKELTLAFTNEKPSRLITSYSVGNFTPSEFEQCRKDSSQNVIRWFEMYRNCLKSELSL